MPRRTHLSRRAVFASGATVVAVATATAVAVTTQSAGASPSLRTQTFQAQATDQLSTGSTSDVVADSDVTGATVIGHDVVTCTATRTHSTCQVAFAQAGGLLYADFVLRDADHILRGRVIGGTGRYRHAHGTLRGSALSASAVNITLSYSIDGS